MYASSCRQVGINFEALVKGALYPQKGIEEIQEEEVKEDDNTTPLESLSSTGLTKLNLGEMEGTLWAKLANYFVSLGEFDMARSVYEEAMEAVSRVRDFSILFDAYSQLEEAVLETAMAQAGDDDDDEAVEENAAPSGSAGGATRHRLWCRQVRGIRPLGVYRHPTSRSRMQPCQ